MRYTPVGEGEPVPQSAAGASQYGSLEVSRGEERQLEEARNSRRRTALVVMVSTAALLLMGVAALATFYSPGSEVAHAPEENTPTLRGPFGDVDYKHKSKKEKDKPAKEVPEKGGKGPVHAHKKPAEPDDSDDDDSSPAPAPKKHTPVHPSAAAGGKGSSSSKPSPAPPAKKTPSPAPLPTSWPSHCRNCTYSECQTLQCNAEATPFACVKGMAKDGCSKVESVFLNPSCADCCSLKSCATLWPGCGQCSAEECAKWKVPCGETRPYICLTGDAHGGCSNATSDWGPANYFNGVCTKCCDLGTCNKARPCGKCTKSECLQFQVGCGVLRPYACTEGDAHGGCAETEAYWQHAEDTGICSRCCNTALC